MKYMVVWSISEANMAAAVKKFKKDPPEIPGGVILLGRWHEMGVGDGFSLFEADDPIALSKYLLAWSDLVDQKIYPVVNDEEAAQAL